MSTYKGHHGGKRVKKFGQGKSFFLLGGVPLVMHNAHHRFVCVCVFCNFIFWFHLPCSFPTVNSLCDRHDHRLEQNIILNWVSKDRPSSQRNQTNLKMDCHVNKHLRGAEPIPCLKKVTVKKLLIPTWQIYSPESSLVTACNSKTDGSPGSAILSIKVKLSVEMPFC